MGRTDENGYWIYELPDMKVWDRPPTLEVGDATEEEIFMEVGRTTSAWESLEWMLATLYSEVLGSHSYAAARSYGMVTTAQVRAQMLVEVLEIAQNEDQTKTWGSLSEAVQLLKHYGKASTLRNHIAHGLVVGISNGVSRPSFYLAPAGYITKQTTSQFERKQSDGADSGAALVSDFGYKYAYTSAQIRVFRENVHEIFGFCSALVDSLRQHWHERSGSGGSNEAGRILLVKSSPVR